jgi:hypothetical protein
MVAIQCECGVPQRQQPTTLWNASRKELGCPFSALASSWDALTGWGYDHALWAMVALCTYYTTTDSREAQAASGAADSAHVRPGGRHPLEGIHTRVAESGWRCYRHRAARAVRRAAQRALSCLADRLDQSRITWPQYGQVMRSMPRTMRWVSGALHTGQRVGASLTRSTNSWSSSTARS